MHAHNKQKRRKKKKKKKEKKANKFKSFSREKSFTNFSLYIILSKTHLTFLRHGVLDSTDSKNGREEPGSGNTENSRHLSVRHGEQRALVGTNLGVVGVEVSVSGTGIGVVLVLLVKGEVEGVDLLAEVSHAADVFSAEEVVVTRFDELGDGFLDFLIRALEGVDDGLGILDSLPVVGRCEKKKKEGEG